MKTYDDINVDDQKFTMGNQPHKTAARKIKKQHSFSKFERDFDDLDSHRNNYKRAAGKYIARAQIRVDELMF